MLKQRRFIASNIPSSEPINMATKNEDKSEHFVWLLEGARPSVSKVALQGALNDKI